MPGFVNREETINGKPSPSSRNFVSKALKSLSSFGMMYDDMVLRNSKAIGVNEDMYGWKLGLKTGMYYLRVKPKAQALKGLGIDLSSASIQEVEKPKFFVKTFMWSKSVLPLVWS